MHCRDRDATERCASPDEDDPERLNATIPSLGDDHLFLYSMRSGGTRLLMVQEALLRNHGPPLLGVGGNNKVL
jgi:hypothetical protein